MSTTALAIVVALLALAAAIAYRRVSSLLRSLRAMEETNRNLELVVEARTEQLHRSERKYRSLIGQASVGILLWHPETLRIQEANARAGELLGVRPRDLVQRALGHLFPDNVRAGATRALRGITKVGIVRLEETSMERLGHGPFPVEINTSLIRLGDKLSVLGILQDLTEKKELERRAALSNEQARRTERMASIGQLAAGVAHEINNPMGYVASNVNRLVEYSKSLEDLVQRSTADVQAAGLLAEINELVCEVEETAQDASEGIARVADIVRALREFSHGGQSSQTLLLADVNNIVSNCLTLAHNEIKGHADVRLDLNEIPQVRCQPTQVAQVVMNLLRNAAQAMNGRGNILVGTYVCGDRVQIVIEDDGCGIPADQLPHIFEPFFTTKEVGQGTGLGLAVSREMIRNQGGEIWVDSVEGSGTRFLVELGS